MVTSDIGYTEQIFTRVKPYQRARINRAKPLVVGQDSASVSDFLREAAFLLCWLIEQHGSEYRQAVGAPNGPIDVEAA